MEHKLLIFQDINTGWFMVDSNLRLRKKGKKDRFENLVSIKSGDTMYIDMKHFEI